MPSDQFESVASETKEAAETRLLASMQTAVSQATLHEHQKEGGGTEIVNPVPLRDVVKKMIEHLEKYGTDNMNPRLHRIAKMTYDHFDKEIKRRNVSSNDVMLLINNDYGYSLKKALKPPVEEDQKLKEINPLNKFRL